MPKETPDVIKKSLEILEQSAQYAIGPHYRETFNQNSLECYFDGMELPWSTNGDRE